MLSAGSSKYAIDLLKEAGVDMTTSAPFDAAIAEMTSTMDELEKILARQPPKGTTPGTAPAAPGSVAAPPKR
jgi:oligoendopeptidase F